MKLTLCSLLSGACALTFSTVSVAAEKKIVEGGAVVTKKTASKRGPLVARVSLESKSGSTVAGTVEFYSTKDGFLVEANVKNLTPGEHGFHVHEKGDCSAADAASAGGHFNPTQKPHAAPGMEAHRGDFGNLVAKKDGTATLSLEVKGLSEANPVDVFVGKAVIVHEKADDLKTQPTGNAGGRVACGVIEKAPAAE